MDRKAQLIASLQNLKKSGKNHATLDIDLVLECITTEEKQPKKVIPRRMNVDGGLFSNDLDK